MLSQFYKPSFVEVEGDNVSRRSLLPETSDSFEIEPDLTQNWADKLPKSSNLLGVRGRKMRRTFSVQGEAVTLPDSKYDSSACWIFSSSAGSRLKIQTQCVHKKNGTGILRTLCWACLAAEASLPTRPVWGQQAARWTIESHLETSKIL